MKDGTYFLRWLHTKCLRFAFYQGDFVVVDLYVECIPWPENRPLQHFGVDPNPLIGIAGKDAQSADKTGNRYGFSLFLHETLPTVWISGTDCGI